MMISLHAYFTEVVQIFPPAYQTLGHSGHYLLVEAQLNPSIHLRNPMLLHSATVLPLQMILVSSQLTFQWHLWFDQ